MNFAIKLTLKVSRILIFVKGMLDPMAYFSMDGKCDKMCSIGCQWMHSKMWTMANLQLSVLCVFVD